jgi:hypothetical protein
MSISYTTGSPGISFIEQAADEVVINQSVSIGGIVIDADWGPSETISLISSESGLVNTFGRPTDDNYKHIMSAANFLAYSQNLRVIRAVNQDSKNAAEYAAEATLIKSYDDFLNKEGFLGETHLESRTYARYPGVYGNSIRVILADKYTIDNWAADNNGVEHILKPYINQLLNDNSVVYGCFVDNTLKEFGIYSLDPSARTYSGLTNYLFSAVNAQSSYIYLVRSKIVGQTKQVMVNPGTPAIPDDPLTVGIDESDPGTPPTYITVPAPINMDVTLSGGVNIVPGDGDFMRAWDMFADPDTSDVALLMQGGTSQIVGNYLVSIAEQRRDSIALVSPQLDNIANLNPNQIVENLKSSSENFGFSKYRFMDGNYKLQYDKYNEVLRWVPLNGDIAGIFAETDAESAPWFSPGGRLVKNTTKLAFYPSKAQRDVLYQYKINPVTSFQGTGAILYGDWTGADLEDASNFVNVRRLLNYLEKSIQVYARRLLWQLNDQATADSFVYTVEPFMRGVEGGRGVAEYKIIADATLNTPEVVGTGKFIVKLLIRPIFSIRWVELVMEIYRNQAIITEQNL